MVGEVATAGAPPIDAFVLAGGRSQRMGRNKALLEFAGVSVIERVIAAAAAAAGRVVLVSSDPEPYRHLGCEIVPDRWPDSAALGGIGTALTASSGERALVLACDLPLVSASLLAWLVALDAGADVTVPRTREEGLHPLCAVYSRRCLPPIGRQIGRGQLKVAGFFDEVLVRVVEQEELAAAGFPPGLLANVNTPEEYERARRSLG